MTFPVFQGPVACFDQESVTERGLGQHAAPSPWSEGTFPAWEKEDPQNETLGEETKLSSLLGVCACTCRTSGETLRECLHFALAPRPVTERNDWDGHWTSGQPVLSQMEPEVDS